MSIPVYGGEKPEPTNTYIIPAVRVSDVMITMAASQNLERWFHTLQFLGITGTFGTFRSVPNAPVIVKDCRLGWQLARL